MPRPRHRSQTRTPAQPREVRLAVEKPIYGGNFLARVGGKAHFIPFAIPGELAVAQIIEEKKSYARCKLVQISTPSAQRTTPPCPHFTLCGGCDYQHADYETQLQWKRAILAESLSRAGVKLPAEVHLLSAGPLHYRNRIRLAVDASGRLGYRARDSHRVIAISQCPIAEPRLIAAARQLETALSALPSISVEEVELFAAPGNAAILARIHARSPRIGWLEQLASLVTSITGAELLKAGSKDEVTAQTGLLSLTYELAGTSYRVANGAFFQVNQNLLTDFVRHVINHASTSSTDVAWDLYCGVGLFARQLASRFKKIIAVESAPLALESLAANLDGCNAEIIHATTESFLQGAVSANRPSLVLVDPPRAGLGTAVAAQLNQIQPRKILYVSCDPATLARDLQQFTNYEMTSLTMADLFPQTFHLEAIAVLELK